MQSNNPVFRNSDEFNGRGTNAYGNQVYGAGGAAYTGYGQAQTSSDPSTWGVGTPGSPTHTETSRGPMTIDSVVQKTGLSLLVLLVTAFATWVLTPAISHGSITQSDANQLYSAMAIGGLGAFGLSMVNSFKRVISPALVLAFCALEGVALGAFSKFFEYQYGHGIVIQAVIGTFAAFAGTLAAYKFFDIKVSSKFRMGVIAAMFGMVGLSILQLVVGVFGGDLGIGSLTGIGFVFSLLG
ncbi:MAG: hypothetical protein QOK30_1766, partial [Nocardioidaceae bacterium]|nr:hypothetical protein [Nocardioidaceae bacterium]